MLDFMAKRLNVQLARLKQRNSNAFMFVDEPGLQFLFSAMSGYDDLKAKGDLDQFFAQVDRPRGIHLCGNPDWDFLLNLDLDVLSLDVYTNAAWDDDVIVDRIRQALKVREAVKEKLGSDLSDTLPDCAVWTANDKERWWNWPGNAHIPKRSSPVKLWVVSPIIKYWPWPIRSSTPSSQAPSNAL
jgi:hypothetical protein